MNEIKTINDLRGALADEFKNLAEGKSNAQTADAMTNIAGKILVSVRLEMEYQKMISTNPQIHIDFIKSNEEKQAALPDQTKK